LQKKNINVCEVGQNVKNLSPAMKFVEALIYEKRLHYNCPILTWMFSNVVVKEDKNQNIFPFKQRMEDKIDLCSALFSAICRAMLHEDNTSIYETQELFVIEAVPQAHIQQNRFDEFTPQEIKPINAPEFDASWLQHGWR